MGLFGGSRIDGMTVFLVVTLIVYTILVAGVYATFTDSEFETQYGDLPSDFRLGETVSFTYNDYKNVTPSFFAGIGVEFTELSPSRYGYWWDKWIGEPVVYIRISSINWWQYGTVKQEPEHTIEWILDNYDYDLNQTTWIVDKLTDWETWVFIKPQLYYNETSGEVTYLYDSLEESIENDVFTMVLSTNATLEDNFNIGKVFGLLSGLDLGGLPAEIGYLTSAVFYALLILASVKLVIG